MAIAFDNSGHVGSSGSASPFNFSVGVGGLARMLVVHTVGSSAAPSGVTYGGVAMIPFYSFSGGNSGQLNTTGWYLLNPATGSNAIVVTDTSGSTNQIMAVSYTGASGIVNVVTQNQQTTPILVITPSRANSWIGIGGGAFTGGLITPSGASLTLRSQFATSPFWSGIQADSNGVAGTSPLTVNIDTGGASSAYVGYEIQVWEFQPVTQSVTVTDAITLFITKLFRSVSDSTAVTDTPSISDGKTVDTLVSLVTSSYKWLTSTLLTAQQQFSVRPYFTCQVVDDTIQPNAQFFSGTGKPLGNGSMATAPDGKVFAVGLDESNNLAVWNDSNLNAHAGVWANKTILNTSTSANYADSNNVYSIAISDWIGGTYQIDIFYFYNFAGDGTALKIGKQTSTDGGVTWGFGNFTTLANYLNTAIEYTALAAWKPVWVSGTVQSNCFYIQPTAGAAFNSGFTGYDIYYGPTSVSWGYYANSYDWTIQGLAAYYLNGVQYCAFSGFRNVTDAVGVNQNFSIWITSVLNKTNIMGSDLWMNPVPAMPVGSASSVNQNSFTFPAASVVNNMAYVTMLATVVESISQTSRGSTAQVVDTHVNCMLIQSDDGTSFSYPSVFIGTDDSEFDSGARASFVAQGSYWYLGGAEGWLWQYVQNQIFADISQDVIGYTISEQAGQPSSISLKLANANNKWVGAAPTGQGAAAIARNRKIALWQGYYNASSVPEAVPHNVYFIDDIQQQVSGTQNDVLLVGRDLYKSLKTTVTKFSYTFAGPTFFSDIFDGTFMSNWNQLRGTWRFVSNVTPPLLGLQVSDSTESKIMLVGTNGTSYASLMRVFFRSASNVGSPHSHGYFYAVYIDDSNWLRLDLDTNNTFAWTITKCVAGVQTDLDTGSLPLPLLVADGHYYGIFIRRYGYYKFNFMIEQYQTPNVGNEIQDYDPATTSYVFKNSGNGEFDLSGVFNTDASWQTSFTVGLGSINSGPTDFRFFFYSQFNSESNLGLLLRRIARIAGIFAFKLTYTWRELMFTNNFSPGEIHNRILTVAAGAQAISQINQMSNGEVTFKAKATVSNNTVPAGFSFIFRKSNDGTGQDDYYKLHVIQASTGFNNPPVFARFERYVQNFSNKTYNFYNTPYDVSNNQSSVGSINIDITQWNTYKIVMIDGWFWAFINGQMVASWNDNNVTIDYQTTGKWGFESDANGTLQVQQITAPDFWKPVPAFAYNPGDDAESTIMSLLTSLRAWLFSDLFGRLKTILLNATDPSTYTYNSQLFQQNVDESDKEYASQVTVYGSGVAATARNTSLMPGVRTREIVVVDYTITTQTDAQTRAANVLTNANQFLNQNASKQIINVGAELFDVVTVVNTGSNTSGVNSATRVYDQTIDQGGGSNNSDFFLEIDTGNVD